MSDSALPKEPTTVPDEASIEDRVVFEPSVITDLEQAKRIREVLGMEAPDAK